MSDSQSNRRAFLTSALALMAVAPGELQADANQAREGVAYWLDLPPKGGLWALAMFLGEDMVEVTVASSRRSKQSRGRFDGQRLVEVSWQNDTDRVERVAVSARNLNGNRELAASYVRHTPEQHLFIGYGQRPRPVETTHRSAGYPFEVLFVGLVVY